MIFRVIRNFIDDMIKSNDEEVLEVEGASQQGIKIIDEINRVYKKTNLIEKIVYPICQEAHKIYSYTGRPVKILEIGMRDGYILKELSNVLQQADIPMELHGIEFKNNTVNLAKERLEGHPQHIQCHYDSTNLHSFPTNSFDIVFSAFVLHHQSPDGISQLLEASFKVSRYSVLHIDLSRSLMGLIALWIYYTLFGYWLSRHDAILSCRRAFKSAEIMDVLKKLKLSTSVTIKYMFPFYFNINRAFDVLDTRGDK